jgi:hypothetical protein
MANTDAFGSFRRSGSHATGWEDFRRKPSSFDSPRSIDKGNRWHTVTDRAIVEFEHIFIASPVGLLAELSPGATW